MKDIKQLLQQGPGGRVLMTVFPHPDDESMPVGGLVIAARQAGWKVVVVSITAGGAGQIHIKGNGKSLKDIRGDELRQAAKCLGASDVEIGDFDDGKLKTESGWKKWVEAVLEKYHPEVVVTYDPSGFYGHPDHIVVSKYLYSKFLQQTEAKWQLWFMAVPDLYKGRWMIPGMEKVLEQMVQPDYKLNLGWNWIRKWRAVKAHKSQRLGKDLPVPLWMFMAICHYEWYHVVERDGEYRYKYIDYKI